MSNDDQMAEIGRLVTDYKESERRIAALESALETIGDKFKSVGSLIKQAARKQLDNPVLEECSRTVPSPDRARELLVELREEARRNSDLLTQKS